MADETDEATADTPAEEPAAKGATGESAVVDAEATVDADVIADDATATSAPAKAGDKDTAGDKAKAGDKDKAKTGDKAKAGDKTADKATPDRTVVRRQVTSKRVTPKGGAAAAPSTPKKAGSTSAPEESRRYTPPGQGAYAQGPSPWWVPALMFGLLIVGAAIIMTNYMGVFGDAANIRLVIGLGFILGGIVTATQYR